MTSRSNTSMEATFPSTTEYVAEARVLQMEGQGHGNVPVARTLRTTTAGKQEMRRWHSEPQRLPQFEQQHQQDLGSSGSRWTHFSQQIPASHAVPCAIPSHFKAQEHRGFSTSVPRWYDILKTVVMQHCFGPDFHYLSRVPDVAEKDVIEFIASINPPASLTPQQKALLSELLQNMENWWSSSFDAMQGIHEESNAVMGFNALPIPPSPLPLQIQRRLKTLVQGVLHLLNLPTAPESMTNDGATEPIDDVRFWKMLGQEYRHDPKIVLKEWLFQRFDRPYPSDKDKNLLAAVTGMTKTQVSNWFINARVRIWQPLVVELGKELDEESGILEHRPMEGPPDGTESDTNEDVQAMEESCDRQAVQKEPSDEVVE